MKATAQWIRISMLSAAILVIALFAAACDNEGDEDGLDNNNPGIEETAPGINDNQGLNESAP